MRRTCIAAATVAAALACASAAGTARADGLRRLAVIVGNDSGGRDTRPLLYARADARKVHEILTRLGGVRGDDAALILDGTADDVLAALGEMERRARDARAQGDRVALIVYYSGHAKDGMLRLGATQLALDSLKARLSQAPVDVRIGIFDSCRSGMLTRTKGARKAPAFDIESKSARDAQGLVILTSSASDEDSQESDLIGGSYFSHHLASGLLGSADRSGDGRVTLFEAYAYAYDRTVADTAESAAGAQHPTFSYDLAGNGDLVLTDVGGRREGLYFPRAAPVGIYYLVDTRGFVAAEVVKAADADRRIALAPGRYRVKRRLADRLRVGDVQIASGQLATLDEATLRDAPFSDDPVKGPDRGRYALGRWTVDLGGTYQAVFDTSARENLFPVTGLLGLELQIHDVFHDVLHRHVIWGFDGALGGSSGTVTVASSGAALPFRFSEVTLASSLQYEWPHLRVTPFAGVRLALMMIERKFDNDTFPNQSFRALSPGVVGGLKVRIVGGLGVAMRLRISTFRDAVTPTETRSFGYWELATTVNYAL